MEQVLFVHKEIDVFKIPPRVGASGWRSGEWRLADKIFTGRVRVVATGEALEVRLEDPATWVWQLADRIMCHSAAEHAFV